jgi:hypothetical protein
MVSVKTVLKKLEMAKKRKRIGIKEADEMLNNLDLDPILDSRVRQVKWLFNNSNKCTMVYDEKLVRLMIHKLQERIKELECGVSDLDAE